jgi:U5 small nuclear ribonucleoprotein component
MESCDPKGPLVIHVTKLYPSEDRSHFDAYGRIFSGSIRSEQRVRVLGESFTVEDEEDMAVQVVTDVWMYESRYRFRAPSLGAGNWVLIGGVDASIMKTATIVDTEFPNDEDAHIFRPLRFPSAAIIKIAVEPMNPTELPKMLDGLRKINKSYPLAVTKVSLRVVGVLLFCLGRGIRRTHHSWQWRALS